MIIKALLISALMATTQARPVMNMTGANKWLISEIKVLFHSIISVNKEVVEVDFIKRVEQKREPKSKID